MHLPHIVVGLSLSAVVVLASPVAKGAPKKPSYPFKRIIAFGDNLSDNGNGSYAHCVADPQNCQNPIYGYRTWTNGPVAVSYLADLIGVPLAVDYAFGEADGGSKIGATINNSYTPSMYAPDAFTQVKNYTSTKGLTRTYVAESLHFLWIGNNDVSLRHIYTSSAVNTAFATEMASMMKELVQRLVNAGAEHIFVPAIYPKQLSVSAKYMAQTPLQYKNLGLAIALANDVIGTTLAKTFGNKVVLYDAYDFLVNLNKNHNDYGITHIQPEVCDGYSQADYNLCIAKKQGQLFYWTQQTDFTTRVHSLLASDMYSVIKKNFS